ncbi:hypothetical protein RJD38_18395 [Vibrio scophthalmi]|uniref:Uncharacterized protein n=1 Tax=Vibrio scophthalmi TaxID=45658 RepID=A0A1C7FFF7_9VIBR|nr:hypothetical protein [Vibrio scophthalmi]ANU38084.1 hypothetical protein VSVS05_03038 [Vibrio scophthalmi]
MKKITLFLLLFYLPLGSVLAQDTLHKSAIDALVTPTLLLGKGRYSQASESFHAQSTAVLTLEKQLGAQGMWQVAGLAEGLAAIAAEKSNNPIAYQYWSNSVRYFLMSGGSWSQLQSQLHQEFEQATTRLQVNMAPGDTGASIDNTWLELFSLVEVWQEKLDYFSYRSPSSGLAQQATKPSASVSGDNRSNGSQLRQYSPKKPLQLNGTFRGKKVIQTNVNTSLKQTQSAKTSAPRVTPIVANNTNDTGEQNIQPKTEQQPVTIVTPIVVEGDIIERDHVTKTIKADQQASSQTESKSEEKLISRGNLGSESSKGVEASQRRSFAPSTE